MFVRLGSKPHLLCILVSCISGCSNPGSAKIRQEGLPAPSSSSGDAENRKETEFNSKSREGLQEDARNAGSIEDKTNQNPDTKAANSVDDSKATAATKTTDSPANFLTKAAADEQMNGMIKQIKESGAGDVSEAHIAAILDFLIQDVCLDGKGNVTSEDPARCASRRNVAREEFLPYVKIDIGQEYPKETNAGWQRSDSVPLLDKTGKWLVMKTFDFGGPRMPDKQWGRFEDFQDGYDATELAGTHLSYMMTKDGNGDNYWSGSGCALNDGWILFPWNIQKNLPGNIAHDIFNVGVRQVCQASSANRASAAWHWLSNTFPFSGGQSLESISTHHWSHESSVASTSFELNYYTREYGATRWESWEKCEAGAQCIAPQAANVCNGNTLMTINSAPWRRVGCRDWSFIQVGTVPFPTFWEGLVTHRICLYGTGNFGDGKTCL